MAQFLEVELPAQNLEWSSITFVFESHMVVLEWTIQMKGLECTCMIATFSKIPCMPIAYEDITIRAGPRKNLTPSDSSIFLVPQAII
jgi:hypothetical protein